MGTHTHKCTYACIPIGEHPHPHRHTQRKKSAKGYTAIPLTEVSKKVQAESKLMVFGNRGPVPGSLGTVKKQFSLCLHIPFHHFSEPYSTQNIYSWGKHQQLCQRKELQRGEPQPSALSLRFWRGLTL